MKTLVYLAGPYSHPDPAVREGRFRALNAVSAKLMRDGLHIFSPISHTHPIALAGDLPIGFDFWQEYDKAILVTCAKLIVLRLDGWEESLGVRAEMQIAKDIGIPVEFMDMPADLRSAERKAEPATSRVCRNCHAALSLRVKAIYHNCMSAACFAREDAEKAESVDEATTLRQKAQCYEEVAGWLHHAGKLT